MKRLREQYRLGLRWLSCGWRLCRRRLWLLLGMGLISSLIINLLGLIQVVGNILLSLCLPILVTSTLLTLDDIASQQRPQKNAGMVGEVDCGNHLASRYPAHNRFQPLLSYQPGSAAPAAPPSMMAPPAAGTQFGTITGT